MGKPKTTNHIDSFKRFVNYGIIKESVDIVSEGLPHFQMSEAGETTNSPIHKFAYFAFNFPPDFIQKVWADNPNMADHLTHKFVGFYKQHGSRAA